MTKSLVVLLHGMGRTRLALVYLNRQLRRAGFDCLNLTYPRRKSIPEIAEFVSDKIEAANVAAGQPDRTIHFVTHSLGGIVVRQLVRDRRPQHLGRVVMLGPPNQGSQLASWLRTNWAFKLAFGMPGQQIHAEADGVPRQLGPVDFDVGVIAGTSASLDPMRFFLGETNDGKVTVTEAKVEGMADYIELPVSHTLMVYQKAAIQQVIHFLRHGEFDKAAAA